MKAFILGAIIAYLTMASFGIIRTFQAMMTYGAGDPQLMAGEIAGDLLASLVWLPILLPILALIQWIARRKYKRTLLSKEETAKDIFS